LIIFNEKDQYDILIKNGFKRFVNLRDLSILARHYNSQGDSREQIKSKLISFSKKWAPQFNESKNECKILQAIDNVSKEKISSNLVIFSKTELDNITKLENFKLQKLIFILMCLAKKDGHSYIYLNTEGIYKLSEIFELAEIKATKSEQEYFLYLLQKSGAIFCNLKPLLRYDLLWCDNFSQKILELKPCAEMILEFEKYIGKPIIRCQRCGKLTRVKSLTYKYCENCRSQI
jgi:hypothetical protein